MSLEIKKKYLSEKIRTDRLLNSLDKKIFTEFLYLNILIISTIKKKYNKIMDIQSLIKIKSRNEFDNQYFQILIDFILDAEKIVLNLNNKYKKNFKYSVFFQFNNLFEITKNNHFSSFKREEQIDFIKKAFLGQNIFKIDNQNYLYRQRQN